MNKEIINYRPAKGRSRTIVPKDGGIYLIASHSGAFLGVDEVVTVIRLDEESEVSIFTVDKGVVTEIYNVPIQPPFRQQAP